MTEKQKRFAIIGGTVLAAVLLLLFFKRGTGGGAVGMAGDNTLPTVTGPSLGPIYLGGSTPTFVIPGLDLSGPNLNMIGACCSDCMQSRPSFNETQGPTFITQNTYNMAGAAPLASANQDFGTTSHYTSLSGVPLAWAQGDRVASIGF